MLLVLLVGWPWPVTCGRPSVAPGRSSPAGAVPNRTVTPAAPHSEEARRIPAALAVRPRRPRSELRRLLWHERDALLQRPRRPGAHVPIAIPVRPHRHRPRSGRGRRRVRPRAPAAPCRRRERAGDCRRPLVASRPTRTSTRRAVAVGWEAVVVGLLAGVVAGLAFGRWGRGGDGVGAGRELDRRLA